MSKIELLEDREHVLLRPGMVIGSVKPNETQQWVLENDKIVYKTITYVPAFLKLFDEIISNSVDESIRTDFQYANQIDVEIDTLTNDITVKDNGRGISADIESKTQLPGSVVAFTHLRAGSNFNDETSTIGQNGVGASCVNIFSKHFEVTTCDGKNKTVLTCKDNMSVIDYKVTKNKIRGTKVSYTPDLEKLSLFSIDETHLNLLKKRVLDLSVSFPSIKFKFCGKVVDGTDFKKYAAKFSEQAHTFTHKNIDIAIFPTEDFLFTSFVNGIDVKRGGNFINHISGQIANKLRDVIAKKYKEIKPQDIKNKMGLVVVARNVNAPRFDSQTKEQLINTVAEMNEIFADVDFDKIVTKLKKDDVFLEPIIDMYRAKEEIKRRKELAAKERKVEKVKVPKHVEALSNDRAKCTLHISEGDSATSSFLACRNKDFHSIFPLRGKFMNVYTKDDSEVVQNKEIASLLSVMGLKLSSSSIDNMRYGKIAILTDMDVDGDAIFASLVSFFYKYWPELIEQGKVVRLLSPLITTKSGKVFYSIDDYEQAGSGEKIDKYNKGLGGLGREAYKKMLNNPMEVAIMADEAAKLHLQIAFGDDAEKRKGWLRDEHF